MHAERGAVNKWQHVDRATRGQCAGRYAKPKVQKMKTEIVLFQVWRIFGFVSYSFWLYFQLVFLWQVKLLVNSICLFQKVVCSFGFQKL